MMSVVLARGLLANACTDPENSWLRMANEIGLIRFQTEKYWRAVCNEPREDKRLTFARRHRLGHVRSGRAQFLRGFALHLALWHTERRSTDRLGE